MNLNDIFGVRLLDARRRDHYRTFFVSDQWYKGDRGSILLFIENGKALFDIGGTRITAGRGDILGWDPGALKESRTAPGGAVSYSLLMFDLISKEGKRPGLRDIGFSFLTRLKEPGPVQRGFESIGQRFHSRASFRLQQCSALCLELLVHIQKGRRFGVKSPEEFGRNIDKRVWDALEYIEKNFKKILDVPTLARKIGMHPVYFGEIFKRATGMPPYRYILEFKIAKAKDFLLNYDAGRIYTGEDLGFHDYSHFYRTFKKMTGLTPTQFVTSQATWPGS